MKKKLTFIIFAIIIFIGICTTNSYARITTNDPTVKSGETVTINISSQEPVASGAIKISSNGGLTFQSASGGTVNGNLVAFSKANNITSGIATYTFKAPEVTETKTYKVVFAAQDMADENGNVVADSNATATVTVNPIKTETNTENNNNSDNNSNNTTTENNNNTTQNNNTQNNNNNNTNTNNNNSGTNSDSGTTSTPIPEKTTLSSLTINGTMYKKYLKTNLSVTVEGLEYITLLPKTSDGSSCTITNKHTKDTATVNSGKTAKIKLQEGSNTITVKGKFDDTYTISVTNKAKDEEVPGNVIEEENKVLLKSLVIKGINSKEEKIDFELTPEFSSEVYEYSVTIPEDKNDITKLDIEAIANSEEFTVEITGNENLVDGENIITILVKSKDGEQVATYQITVNKEVKIVETVATTNIEETPVEVKTINMPRMLTIIFTVVIAIAGVIFAVVEYNYSRNKTEDKGEDKGKDKGKDEEEEVKISFASVGFEKEDTEKEDVLEEIREEEFELLSEEPKSRKKGRHF